MRQGFAARIGLLAFVHGAAFDELRSHDQAPVKLQCVVESLGAAFISSPYQNAYGFALVLLILLVRPYGLFGERGREA